MEKHSKAVGKWFYYPVGRGTTKKPKAILAFGVIFFWRKLLVLRWNTHTSHTDHVFDGRELLVKQLKTRKRVYLLLGTHQNTSFNLSMILRSSVSVKHERSVAPA